MAAIPIPGWETQQLQSLGKRGKLRGLSPSVLAAVDLAESGGQGGGVNSSGYGGWFGLSQSDLGSVGAGLPLSDTSVSAFDQQAVASAQFLSRLSQMNGGLYAGEIAYQGGSQEGVNLFREYGISNTGAGGTLGKGTGPAPNSHSQSQNSGILGWLGSIPGDIGSGIGTVLSFPETAAVDAVGFGVGLVWPLILRLVITFVLIALALIVAWHLIGKTGVGKAAEGAALRAAKTAAMA